MKKIYMLLMILTLFSCGKNGQAHKDLIIYRPVDSKTYFLSSDLDFESYKDSFSHDYSYYINDDITLDKLLINFKEKNFFINEYGVNIVGVCINYADGKKEILINESAWNSFNNHPKEDFLKKQLVYHELGHCVLDRKHDDTALNSYYKLSIMNQKLFAQEDYYSDNEVLFLEELFSKNKSSTTETIPFENY